MNVRITEVGPRDGLQNESATISTETKIRFVDALSDAGFEEIEVSAFVSPERVPQLQDAEQVFE
jgi:hydroxymethylglutaryl-CoA lyase